jgi:hypothetical protein
MENDAESIYNSISFGFDIETGGHVFQLMFTNSRQMVEKGFITETDGGGVRVMSISVSIFPGYFIWARRKTLRAGKRLSGISFGQFQCWRESPNA